MKKWFYFLIVALIISCDKKTVTNNSSTQTDVTDSSWLTPHESGNGNTTATYKEVLDFYHKLDNAYSTISLQEIGITDSGLPLLLVTYSKNELDWNNIYEDKIKILVNNGIHPGESDGIDATMSLMRDLAQGKTDAPDNLIFSTIAVYNIGGALNRNSNTRTNQNGPESHGFRGNARNYDLNRDFIKSDTRNASAFAQAYHLINPDLFIDNHVSNGADYQYTLTHLWTQHNKMGTHAAHYLENKLRPVLDSTLAVRDMPITPYVNVHNSSPDQGFSLFLDHPRYSTGYTSLWNTIGMMVETHMLKPYADRVTGTRAIMEDLITLGSRDIKTIKEVRANAFKETLQSQFYTTHYQLDKTIADSITFLGYEAINKISPVTGKSLLSYDRNKPYSKKIPYYNNYRAIDSIVIPQYYIIPQGQWTAIERLRENNIDFKLLTQDSTMMVESYRIAGYDTSSSAYEGHYPHNNVKITTVVEELRFRESDIIVPTAQPGIKYILETLEPTTADSFFKWNYFDTILQQKEGYSSYVFERTAAKLLEEDEELKKEFDSIKNADLDFSNDARKQLNWLHKKSPHYEKAHLQYPIYRKL